MLQIRPRRVAGEQAPDFTRPLLLMVHCHGRIEAALCALERAAAALRAAGGPRDEAIAAIKAAQAHFAGPGVKHTRDEEASLFPRMRAHRRRLEPAALAALDVLEAQHREAERAHASFDEVAAGLRRSADPSAEEAGRLSDAVAALTALYRPHIRMENEVVYPAAARVLSAAELLAVGEEMRDRRRDLPSASRA